MKIGRHNIGTDHPPYIIAELSGNHDGSVDKALEILEISAEMGAHAVKLQTYTADTITLDCNTNDFKITGGLWDGYRLWDLYDKAHTPWDWHTILKKRGDELGIDVFSSPFDFSAVDFLETLEVPAYKIASFEMTDHSLIRHVCKTGKPVIMSTGMASLDEIIQSVDVLKKHGNNYAILHCISGYPTPLSETNIRTIPHLQNILKCPIGLSDHTLGTTASVTAVALGARIIEKHVCLRRSDGGVDAAFSLEPLELRELVEKCREAFDCLGTAGYDKKDSEKGNVQFRRSLYASQNITAGDTITADNVRSVRPGFGLPPQHYDTIMGMKALKGIPKGTPIQWGIIGSK